MARLTELRTDPDRVKEGVWFRDPWGLGTRHRIASVHTPGFAAEVARIQRETQERSRGDAEVMRQTAQSIATHLWLEWEGIEDDEGNPLPYSVAKAAEWLQDESMGHWAKWIADKASELGAYLSRVKEETGKP